MNNLIRSIEELVKVVEDVSGIKVVNVSVSVNEKQEVSIVINGVIDYEKANGGGNCSMCYRCRRGGCWNDNR